MHFIYSPVYVNMVQEMVRGNRYKTLRWRFIKSLEPPRVVHARCPDMISKGNLYGQVTLRMHSRQVSQDQLCVKSVGVCLCDAHQLTSPVCFWHLSDISDL